MTVAASWLVVGGIVVAAILFAIAAVLMIGDDDYRDHMGD
jgi:hypothetical protein